MSSTRRPFSSAPFWEAAGELRAISTTSPKPCEVATEGLIVAYVYDNSGNPVWYLATGTLTSPTSYSGTWDVYAGGPQLTSPEGAYSAHLVTSATAMTLTFSDATHGTLTMGAVSIPITRFQSF